MRLVTKSINKRILPKTIRVCSHSANMLQILLLDLQVEK